MWTSDTIEWIDIELTSFCNIKCKGCFRVQSDWASDILNKHYITFDTIQQRFKKEMFPNIKIINFCGSVDEPTTHPEFFEIVKYFADWKCHINIATNGSLRTDEWWMNLANILPESHRVTWGIDGSDATSEIYREGSNFNKVQQNWRAFHKAGGKSVWQFIEFEHNQHQTDIARQMAKDEGFLDFRTIISHRKDTGDIKHKKIEHEESPYVSCKYGNQKRIFVNHNGNVIPCCHLNAQMLEYTVSNKINNRFEEILNGNDYINDINLDNVSIDEAINGKVFSAIMSSWTEDDKIPQCWNKCKINNRDVFIQEKL